MQKKIYRIKPGHMLAGGCNGLGEYFNIDPTIVRLVWVLASFVVGIGILAYIIAAIIIPLKQA